MNRPAALAKFSLEKRKSELSEMRFYDVPLQERHTQSDLVLTCAGEDEYLESGSIIDPLHPRDAQHQWESNLWLVKLSPIIT